MARPGNYGVFLTGVDVGAPPSFGVGCDHIIQNEGAGVRLAIGTGRREAGASRGAGILGSQGKVQGDGGRLT